MSEIDSIVSQLETINESLADIAITMIREALESGSDSRAPDKAVSQARRTIAKAIDQLQNLNGSRSD
jgi:hypothetical protein